MESGEAKVLQIPAWMNILIEINQRPDTSITGVGRRADITNAHVAKIVDQLAEQGLIRKTALGRIVNLRLTSEGQKMTNALLIVKTILNSKPKDSSKQVKLI